MVLLVVYRINGTSFEVPTTKCSDNKIDISFKQIKWPITSGSECRSVKQENNLPLK